MFLFLLCFCSATTLPMLAKFRCPTRVEISFFTTMATQSCVIIIRTPPFVQHTYPIFVTDARTIKIQEL